MRPLTGLAAAVALVVALGCACGSGEPCPEGEYVSMGACLPEDCGAYPFGDYAGGDHVFVQEGSYEEDEDGTEDAPFHTLGPGLALAAARPDRPLVVVASGSYPGPFVFGPGQDGLVVQGVCRRDVVLRGADDAPIVDLEGDDDTVVTLADVRLEGGSGPGAVVGRGRLVLDGVDVADTVAAGIAVYGPGSRLDATDLTVVRTRAHEVGSGYGLAVGDGAQTAVERASIDTSAVAGVLVDGPGTAAWLDTVTLDGRLGNADLALQGAGIVVTGGADATVRDTTLTSMFDVAIAVSGPSAATLASVTVLGVQPAVEGGVGGDGTGLSVTAGATVAASNVFVSGAGLYGLAATGAGTTVTAHGVQLVDAAPGADAPDSAGIGLVAADGAAVTATDVVLQGTRAYGAVVSGGAALSLTDAEVLEPAPGALPVSGGLLAQGGATLTATSVAVADAIGVGVLIDGAQAELVDVEVRRTARGLDQTAASGVAVQSGGGLEADGLIVTGGEGPGLLVSGADAACAGCRLADNAFAGIVIIDGGALDYIDGVVLDTAPDANLGGGIGALVDGRGAVFGLDRSEIRGQPIAAVFASGDPQVTLAASVLDGGPAEGPLWPTGTAVFATGSAAERLVLEGDDLQNAGGAGLFLDAASATLLGNRWADNTVDVVQQLCGDEGAPVGLDAEPVATVELCPAYDRPIEGFSFATRYVGLELAD